MVGGHISVDIPVHCWTILRKIVYLRMCMQISLVNLTVARVSGVGVPFIVYCGANPDVGILFLFY